MERVDDLPVSAVNLSLKSSALNVLTLIITPPKQHEVG
jgi:hypothetical protein